MNIITQHRSPDTKNWIDCAPEQAQGFADHGDIVREVVGKSEADAKIAVLNAIVVKAQVILAAHLPPDGFSEKATISELLALLDGPEQREAQA